MSIASVLQKYQAFENTKIQISITDWPQNCGKVHYPRLQPNFTCYTDINAMHTVCGSFFVFTLFSNFVSDLSSNKPTSITAGIYCIFWLVNTKKNNSYILDLNLLDTIPTTIWEAWSHNLAGLKNTSPLRITNDYRPGYLFWSFLLSNGFEF